jgi:hypothetical protein
LCNFENELIVNISKHLLSNTTGHISQKAQLAISVSPESGLKTDLSLAKKDRMSIFNQKSGFFKIIFLKIGVGKSRINKGDLFNQKNGSRHSHITYRLVSLTHRLTVNLLIRLGIGIGIGT